VLYNLKRRGIEWDLLPWCRERRIPIMAYSPIEHSPSNQEGMLDRPELASIAAEHGATPAQVALAWLLQQQGVAVIPKASSVWHVRENREALDLTLTKADLASLDQAFPPPRKKMPLATR
jgi:diketogulonate reductase-like aldo/keto reductase